MQHGCSFPSKIAEITTFFFNLSVRAQKKSRAYVICHGFKGSEDPVNMLEKKPMWVSMLRIVWLFPLVVDFLAV